MKLKDIAPSLYYFRFLFEEPTIEVRVENLGQKDRAIYGYIIISADIPGVHSGHLHETDHNLTSIQTRRSLVKALEDRAGGVDWMAVLESVSHHIRDYIMAGPPLEEVGADEVEELSWKIHPLVPKGEATLFYGDPSSGKSQLVALLSLVTQLPYDGFLGWRAERGHVLYLDYETTRATINRHIRRLLLGMDLEIAFLNYMRVSQPLPSLAQTLHRYVAEQQIDTIVVDSVAWACGGDIEKQEPVSEFFRVLRSLGTTNILVGHTPKNADSGKARSPFGSAFWKAGARYMFEVKGSQQPKSDELYVGLYHSKHNEGPRQEPIGLHFHFDGKVGPVTVRHTNIKAIPELAAGLPLSDRTVGLLLNEPLTVVEMAELLGTGSKTMAVIVSRLHKKGQVVQLGGGRWGVAQGT